MWEVWVGTGAAATAMVCASSESWFAAATFAAVAATLALRSSYKVVVGIHTVANLERSYAGKVVWVTGASRGLGASIAVAFARCGAKVILSARSADKLAEVAKQCVQAHPSRDESAVAILELDLSHSATELYGYGAKAAALFGSAGVDILVNNGGVSSRSAALDTTLATDERVMAINYTAPVALSKSVLASMVEKKQGHIVVISSVQGLFGLPFRSSYSASKHALHGYFDALRAELAADGVGVTTVCPGYVATTLSLHALTGDGTAAGVMDSTTASGMKPSTLAVQILSAVAQGKHELVVCGVTAHIASYLRVLAPDFFFNLMQKRANKMRKAESAKKDE